MTHPAPPPRFDTRAAGADGWYAYCPGEEIRCPGRDLHKKGGFTGRCNKYMGTVQTGTVCVRPEVRLHEGLERRQHTRVRDKCQRCDTPLEIESRYAADAA